MQIKIEIKQIGRLMSPAKRIELIVTDNNVTTKYVVTDSNRLVDEKLILSLRNIADDLEEQNNLLKYDS